MPNVLIIEDDSAISDAYAMVLSGKGYQVHQAPDVTSGLQVAKTVHPEVILLDMLMPGMSGLDFLRQLDLPANLPDTKLIVLSNVESPKVMAEAKQLGAARYLLKIDYTPYEIEKIIQSLLGTDSSKPPDENAG
jgi:DNA-binding NarL/FixJ family response regulator